MIEGMDTVMDGTNEEPLLIEVESRIARSWGDGG
jgi:hypothetical protein